MADELVPLAAFTLTYFLLNSGLNAGIAALVQRRPLWSIWRQHFGAVLLNYCGSASVAALLVYNSRGFSFTTIAIVRAAAGDLLLHVQDVAAARRGRQPPPRSR